MSSRRFSRKKAYSNAEVADANYRTYGELVICDACNVANDTKHIILNCLKTAAFMNKIFMLWIIMHPLPPKKEICMMITVWCAVFKS